jgi:hypothetical protein
MNYILNYLRKLENLKNLSTSNESNVRKVFESLLENYGQEYNLTLISEHPFKPINRPTAPDLKADGILIEQLNKNHRRLTPRECARLQGFPDDFKIVVSDTQAYRQFGNSVAVPVISAIYTQLIKTVNEYQQDQARQSQVFFVSRLSNLIEFANQ